MHIKLRANRWVAWPRFTVLCVVQLWSAHAIAYLMHEYAHAFTAWLLGWKANPFALHYGDLSIVNLLILTKIDENVDYAPIYAQGHGHLAALIAFAGSGIGSLLLYAMCRWLLSGTRLQLHPVWRLFAFWLCLMCVGNFYDYVPIRTFDPQGDVSYIVRGLQVSPWLVLVLLGIPTALAIYQLFATLLPQTLTGRLSSAVVPAKGHACGLGVPHLRLLRRERLHRRRGSLEGARGSLRICIISSGHPSMPTAIFAKPAIANPAAKSGVRGQRPGVTASGCHCIRSMRLVMK
jgi:hypothetical protein